MRIVRIGEAVVVCLVVVFALMYGNAHATVPYVNEPIDYDSSGGTPNADADWPSISHDGRYIAFTSNATDLVASPTIPNHNGQVYLRDRLNDSTTAVSVTASGTLADAVSANPHVSDSGRYVIFDSHASNLDAAASGNYSQTYLKDMQTGSIRLVTINASGFEGTGNAHAVGVSSDGRYAIFDTEATNLVSGVPANRQLVYSKDMQTDAIVILSKDSTGTVANSYAGGVAASCDGRFVLLNSPATNPTPGTSGAISRLYLIDRMNGDIKLITPLATGDYFLNPNISCNGDYITFSSNATTLVSGDTNGKTDAFIYNRVNDTYALISTDSLGNQANGDSSAGGVSDDGRYVVFASGATNLVSGDSNGTWDVFLKDLGTGTTELITKSSSGSQIDGPVFATPVLSADGQYTSYITNATNLVSGFYAPNGDHVYISKTGISPSY